MPSLVFQGGLNSLRVHAIPAFRLVSIVFPNNTLRGQYLAHGEDMLTSDVGILGATRHSFTLVNTPAATRSPSSQSILRNTLGLGPNAIFSEEAY